MVTALSNKLRIKDRLDNAIVRIKGGCDVRTRWYQKIEARIESYDLPEAFKMLDGTRVDSARAWSKWRRPELIEIFRSCMYGRTPGAASQARKYFVVEEGVLHDGSGIRRQVRIELGGHPEGPAMMLLIYLPNEGRRKWSKVPLFLGLNFFGNQTIHNDRAILLTESWVPNNSITRGRCGDMLRGIQSASWPVEAILNQGYGLATAYCGDVVADRKDGLEFGIHKFFRVLEPRDPPGDSWGAISGWAWGLSCAMDYLEQQADIDPRRVAVIGHSRLGKAALWAGAQDERFALVISNESGCCGAALSRRRFRETVSIINRVNPHWLCDNFKLYNDNEDLLPIDQHLLIGLIAPRPVYIASAQLDLAADPMGEFLAAKHADPVYRLLGTEGLPKNEMPSVNSPVMGTIGYHLRKGGHGITKYDWAQYLTFEEKHHSQGALVHCNI